MQKIRAVNELRKKPFETALIVGSRNFVNYEQAEKCLDWFFENNPIELQHIISGGARGADSVAHDYAHEKKIDLIEMPVTSEEWRTIGKSAGYKRNNKMHERLVKDDYRICIAFWDGQSKGTAQNFDLCRRLGTPCIIFYFKDNPCTITDIRVLDI